jgi:glycosyltransferase involved in cell wall biosynthesis
VTVPQFSILVPTRQRPDTLGFTLATLVAQPGDDYEIVVADNFGDAEVARVITEAQKLCPRLRHVRSDRILPMGENWEFGLSACAGKFVTILGDDDGFMPSTLQIARELLKASHATLLNWATHTYWWPDTIAHWNANRLYASVAKNSVEWRSSAQVLSGFFRDEQAFSELPMIYSAFVDRDIVAKVRDRFGGYFVSPQLPPDVASGIVNLMYSERYVHSNRPLAIRGNSKRSNGTAHWARAYGKEQRETYFRDEGKTLDALIHPSLIPSPNLEFCIANIKLHLKDVLFQDRSDIQIDLVALVKSTIRNLNHEPESYEENLADALRLADKIGYRVDRGLIPARQQPTARPRVQGPVGDAKSGLGIAVNCDQAGIFDVAAAARLAEAVSPPQSLMVGLPRLMSPEFSEGQKRTSRNELCSCGSGKKYKYCHGALV